MRVGGAGDVPWAPGGRFAAFGCRGTEAFSNKFIHLGLGAYRKPRGSCHHQLAGVKALVDGRDCLRQLLTVIPHGPVRPPLPSVPRSRGTPRGMLTGLVWFLQAASH